MKTFTELQRYAYFATRMLYLTKWFAVFERFFVCKIVAEVLSFTVNSIVSVMGCVNKEQSPVQRNRPLSAK